MSIPRLLSIAAIAAVVSLSSTSTSTAGLTTYNSLSNVFGSDQVVASLSGTVAGAADDNDLIGAGDLIESITAWSGRGSYAAIVWSSTVTGDAGTTAFGSLLLQSATVGASSAMSGSSLDLSSAGDNSSLWNGGNQFAYLLVSDTYDFSTAASFTDIQSNVGSVGIAATFDVAADFTVLTQKSSSSTNVSLTYSADLNLIGQDSLAVSNSFFGTVDGSNEISLISDSALVPPVVSLMTGFALSQATHTLGGSVQLTANTIAAIPEPNSLAIFGLMGIGGCALRRRRNRK